MNRLTFLENTGPSGVISSYLYTLDAVGNRTEVEEDTGRRVEYAYDGIYRLNDELIFDPSNTDPNTPDRSIGYTYDDVGNRLTRLDSAEGTTTYDYDDNDRLLDETLTDLANAVSTTNYSYDDNGNTLSRVTATDQALYDWDFENRLKSADVTDSGVTRHIDYEYDVDGMRVGQTVDGVETLYLLDKNRPFAQVVEERTPGGVIQVSYVHGLDLISQNRPTTTGKSFYHADGLGSTRALTDSSGNVTDRYIYDAFGRLLSVPGPTSNLYLFAGEQRDLNVGLDYLRARWMNPSVGRFYGMDSFPPFMQQPLTLNRFLYANANPVMNIDPSGQFSLTEAILTVAILGVTTAIYSSAQNFVGNLARRTHGTIKWEGRIESFAASSIKTAGAGIAFASVHATSCFNNREATGQWFLLGADVSGPGRVSAINSDIEIESPALFGNDPSILGGFFSTIGGGFIVGTDVYWTLDSVLKIGFGQLQFINPAGFQFGIGLSSGFSITAFTEFRDVKHCPINP